MNEIKLFSRALKKQTLDFTEVNTLSVKKGYIVHPDCCNERVVRYLKTLPDNLNTTFYKSWQDVITKSRLELAIDQVLHYISTYGSNHTLEPYIPNNNPTTIDYDECQTILPITKKEIESKILSLLSSGAALKGDTIEQCVDLINELNLTIDMEAIRNKEAKMHFHKLTNTLPQSPAEMVRYVVYLHTGETLLIKNKTLIEALKSYNSINQNHIDKINKFGLDKLSSVFFRYKPLFLALKKNENYRYLINKLRRLANKNHKPSHKGYWDRILSEPKSIADAEKKLDDITNYKKISILESILSRKKNTKTLPVRVRNGKLYVRQNYEQVTGPHHDVLYDILIRSLQKTIEHKVKGKKIKLHKDIEYALPSSEKNFIGSIPVGSYIALKDNEAGIVGINWKEINGAVDLDLSLMGVNGVKYGWNSNYRNTDNSIIYSGDVTRADPEATELFYCKDVSGFNNMMVYVNLYRGDLNAKYHIFFAKASTDYTARKNSMVDPNDIIFMSEMTCEQTQSNVGFFSDNKFYFLKLSSGNSAVVGTNAHSSAYQKHLQETKECRVYLTDVLKNTDCEIVYDGECDIDLSTGDKSAILDIIS